MSSIWDSINIKKGPGGCGNVSEEMKNQTIENAVNIWENMGLSKDKIAFGIATIGVESGFNPMAKGPSTTETGLGQFNDKTWKDAVKTHNDLYPNRIDYVKGRNDQTAQIQAMGAWIDKCWGRAQPLLNDEQLNDYEREEIVYGLWHASAYAGSDRVLAYLKSGHYRKEIAPYFKDTYDEAFSILDWNSASPRFSN